MSDEPDPPRKFYELKPREFERVNPPRPPEAAPASPPPASAPAPSADPGRPIDVRELFRQAQGTGPVLSSQAKPNADTNDVHAILRDNHARATAAGLNDVSLRPKRPSKRKRDYWLMMIAGTAILGPLAVISGARFVAGDRNAAPLFVYSLAGLIMFNATLWWVMWHIVEDYY